MIDIIQTVTGLVKTEELGFTLTHEHIICDASLCKSYNNKDLKWGEYMCFDNEDIMKKELLYYKKHKGSAIVEVTCHGWGRDPLLLRQISLNTGIKIIACTGFYVEDCMPNWVKSKDINQLSNWIIREIESGCNSRINGNITNVKAGIIKTSVSRFKYLGLELKALKAVIEAHKKTGVPITSHNSGSVRFELKGGNIGTELLEICENEGVNPESIIIGHTDEKADIRNLINLIKKGAWVQFDTIGKEHYILDDTRAELVKKINEKGFLDHLLLSQDRNRKPMLKHYGGPGYSDIINRFIPILKQKGLNNSDIEQLFYKNPAKALRVRDKH